MITDDYILVYQGGHHNVYCNGDEHLKTGGGWAGVCPQPERNKPLYRVHTFKCDCEYWKKWNLKYGS